ncbi:threonine synthase [Flavilitoribacter nigricans]|uniref:Threonine synthase n=1 Tax=Flavilitoribacter nigricans (strain ATCC 23147 / DSM 23189 / NBRC 102662 / NCIMB 1420 / SS-2) TaxID=1122177 RepID=A0A2D0N5B0_FLAN2|nr:threonine synthase [Flavilitoribacter nigricans]PHN03685.1 threonine synthase [Flavilitoribacter nigricans DSM 23189 = NBRC 102662]
MQLYSTKNKSKTVSLPEAVFKGLPEDNGLYMPTSIPRLPQTFIDNLEEYSFQEIGFTVCKHLIGDSIPEKDLEKIIENAISFPAPVVKLDDQKYILELFHGPSLAFKDFGARFMAQLMSYFNQESDKELIILVATSGDTGGAVAAGFLNTPGIQVVILYPSGKVSPLQEKQLTTLGGNITALEVDGTFDDCQALVKKAFLDSELRSQLRLSSANSINISRLIPQSFYYFEAYKQVKKAGKPTVFCVPSGNFGNLTAGLIAAKMGLPVHHFIAATNQNDIVPSYLKGGHYHPKPSVRTLSNAMDVGNPSNFARMVDLYSTIEAIESSPETAWPSMKEAISGYAFDDQATRKAMNEVAETYNYTIDPHGAVGYLALKDYQKEHPDTLGIILETAHPAKFKEDVEDILGHEIPVPERLAVLSDRKKVAKKQRIEYPEFREWLMDSY